MNKGSAIITQVQDENHTQSALSYFGRLAYDLCSCVYIKRLFNFKYFNSCEPKQIPHQKVKHQGLKTLILDLDETLVHSSFTYVPDSDFTLSIRVGGQNYKVYVRIRPGAEDFIKEMSKIYEVVIFTASLAEYANPVIDKIDPQGLSTIRLYRENCSLHNNVFVKDLSKLNRNLKDLIIIDNSQTSFMLQPLNAIHIKNFFSDQTDTELYDLIPFLKLLQNVPQQQQYYQFEDVRPIPDWHHKYNHFERFNFKNVHGSYIIFNRNPEDDHLLDLRPEDQETLKVSLKIKAKFLNDSVSLNVESEESNFLFAQKNHKLQVTEYDDEEQILREQKLRQDFNLNSPSVLQSKNKKESFILQEDEDDEEEFKSQ